MKQSSFFPLLRAARPLQALALATAMALAAGCASHPDVRHDQDPAVDLQAYQSFGFFEPLEADGPYGSLIGHHLLQGTREQLERQHYRYDAQNPDLRVAVFLFVADRQELRATPGRGPFGYRGWNGGLETVDYRQGTLRVDLVDTRRNALVWQGVAEGRVDDQAMKNPGLAVQAALDEIFARYPGSKRP